MRLWLAMGLAVCAFAQVVDEAKWEALADQVRRQGKPVDGEIQDYLRRVGLRVAAGERWKVEAIDGEVGYGTFAAWMPGQVFVPVRLLRLARSEGEVAGILAHAMSHRPETSVGGTIVGVEGAVVGEEIRADRLAVARMVKAGYHPQALLDYLERVGRPVPDRVAALQESVAGAPRMAEAIENTSEFVEMQARVRAVKPTLPRSRPSLYRKL